MTRGGGKNLRNWESYPVSDNPLGRVFLILFLFAVGISGQPSSKGSTFGEYTSFSPLARSHLFMLQAPYVFSSPCGPRSSKSVCIPLASWERLILPDTERGH